MERRIILKGGTLPPPKSESAIEINGKTLEELVAEQESEAMGEQLVPDNVIPYHKSRARYTEEKGKRSVARVWTRREINAENWEEIMEHEKTMEGVMAALLLSGREVPGVELMNNCMRRLNVVKKKYSQRSSYLFSKTDFGRFVVKRREGKGTAYKLVPAALELKVEELMHFVYKGNKKGREAILEHHKGLRPYLEVEKPIEPDPPNSDEDTASDEPAKAAPIMTNLIENAISQALGVNVIVKGRIDIVFRWE